MGIKPSIMKKKFNGEISLKNKTIVTITILLVLVVFILAGDFISNQIKTRLAAKNFLQNLTEGNFDKTFEYVSYFDHASDFEPEISYDKAKNSWVKRVQQLKARGVYVKSYRNLKIWSDDGYPRGRVILTIIQSGNQVEREVNIHFNSLKKKWKVQNIYPSSGADQSELEKAISGKID